ncbi:MAG: succinylglutamate desuccinylase/aspartoacylase family protein [Caldilineaceae bacterium]|nr:succinylglutamate desuccinylase/aspartoacylase family protein [Caldilineaceae bacterium]
MLEFSLDALPEGVKTTGWMQVAPRVDGGMWRLPVLSVRGSKPGPTLVVLGAVHGDEYEGVEAIPQAFAEIDPAVLNGTLVMVPVCNLPAYEAALRSSPVDGLNLARVFPGQVDGTVTERIAHALTEQLFRHADFLLDLHSGGVAYEIPTLVGYIHDDGELGQRSLAAAQAFGAPVMWGHPLPMPPGRSLSAAVTLGVPCLYTEAPGGGSARPADVACFRRGILNLMRHLGMLAGTPETPAHSLHLVGDGNLDIVTTAPVAGYFRPSVALLDFVQRGEPLGSLLDFFGNTLATVTAGADGVVIMLRRLHRVHVGEGLLQVTNRLEDYLAMRP